MKKVMLVVMAISLFAVSIVSAAQMRPIPPPAPAILLSTDCSFLTWLGALCHDTDDGKLYKWDGASLVEIEAASGTGDITDVFNCSSGDCATLTAGAADALNMTSASYSIPWAIGTDCSAVTAEGRACWDSDDNKLYVGNGAAAIPFESIAATDYVAKALFDAQTVLAATSDNTPAALTITEQTVVGRATGANIAALAIDSDLASVSASDNTVPSAKATKAYADLMVPKTTYDANTVLYATSDDTPAALTVTEQTVVGRVTGGNIAALAIDSDLASVSATDNTVPSAKSTKAYVDNFVGSTNIVTVGTIGTGTWNATAIAGAKVDIHGTTEETNIAADDEILIYDATASANKRMTRGNFVSGLSGGGGVILDLADNGVDESTAIAEIATSGDTNSIFTEPTNDKLLIDLSKKWPAANTADTATALVSNGSNCSSGYAPLGVDASGAVEGCFQVQPLDATLTALAGLTIADVSVIEGTGSDAVAVVSSGGALRYFRSNVGNTALEFAAITQDDIADGSSYQRVAASDVDASNHVNLVQDIDGTGAITITGPTATRAITIDDAAQELAARNRANTFTENNTFGNADTDTLTLRSLLVGGNSRAVWIAGSAPTPTYATGTNELYVTGDIETAGTIYAAAFNGGTGTDTQRRLSLASNSSFDCSTYPDSVYFSSDAIGWCESTTAKVPMKLSDSQTVTGNKTFTGSVYFGDASNAASFRMYDGSSNYWTLAIPAMSSNYTLTLPTDDGTTGQYLQTDGSGALSWGTPSATAAGSDTHVQFNDGGSALGGDADLTFNKTTARLQIGSNGTGGGLVIYNELGGTDYSNTIIPNSGQGAAATITLPAATSTLATLSGNSFTGAQVPASNDGAAIGSASYSWSDLFLASGGVINWNNGNATLTHSTGLLTSNVPLSLGTSNAFTTGTIELGAAADTTLARVSAGVISIEGDEVNLGGNLTTAAAFTTAGAFALTLTATEATNVTLPASGTLATTALVAVDFGLTADADAGDYDVHSIDGLYGVDDDLYIDMGTDGTLTVHSDTNLDLLVGDDGLRITDGTDQVIINTGNGLGVTSISFSALNLVTTGTILGAVNVVVTTDGSESPTAAQMYGTMFIADHDTATSDTTYTLPAAATGMAACFYDNGGGTGGITIEIDGSDVIILDGAPLTAGNTIDSPGVAGDGANGDYICLMAIDATNWITLGRSGTWVDGGAT